MKPIELTQEQKDKLLEMCVGIFPEYAHDSSKDEAPNVQIIFNDFVRFYSGFKIRKAKPTLDEIHWYEFCITKLAPILLPSDGIVIDFDGKYSPIEFLYKYFQQWKREE